MDNQFTFSGSPLQRGWTRVTLGMLAFCWASSYEAGNPSSHGPCLKPTPLPLGEVRGIGLPHATDECACQVREVCLGDLLSPEASLWMGGTKPRLAETISIERLIAHCLGEH